MNLKRTHKDEVVAYFKVLLLYLPAGIKNDDNTLKIEGF